MPTPEATTLFRGCRPELAVGPSGVILGVGKRAAAFAGPKVKVVELEGRVLPGLADSHLHLDWLAEEERWVRLGPEDSWGQTLERLRQAARRVSGGWLLARGLNRTPTESEASALDRLARGLPVLLLAPDAHSGLANRSALAHAGVPVSGSAGKLVGRRREGGGVAAGYLQEGALDLVVRKIPPLPLDRRRQLTWQALTRLAAAGLTSIHCMDSKAGFEALAELHRAQTLPLRVSWFAPEALAADLIGEGVEAGRGDERLRIFGVKAFLDGTLGSGTAALLDGRGELRMTPVELRQLALGLYRARLNLAVHAIGDRAVRVALDAFSHLPRADFWRPRIEHAQLVQPADRARFATLGVTASMQPYHAVMDLPLARERWPGRGGDAYAWSALARAGATLAFGSDAPVASFDPLLGLAAATAWRRRVRWHPDLALTRKQALAAYTAGAAYAVGMEARLGRVTPGYLCDLTLVKGGRVVATVVGGELVSPR